MAAESRGSEVEAVAIGFLVLTWVFVLLRCYVRVFMTKGFGPDDWLAFASQVFFTIYCAFVLKGVDYGTGQHLRDIPQEDIPIALKWWYLCEVFYVACTTVFKASICVFIGRVCMNRAHSYIIYGTLSTVVVFSLAYLFIIIFQCSPSSYFWTQYTGGTGECLDGRVIQYASYVHSVLSAIADWTIGIIPIFIVRSLTVTLRTKIVVAMILALGAVGSTATIIRIPFLKQLALDDFLYSTTDVAIWSTVEPGVGITAAAMACLRPLCRTFLSRNKSFGSSNAKRINIFPYGGTSGYIRSGDRTGSQCVVELGLRDDVGEGNGITTTIKHNSPPPPENPEIALPKRARACSIVKTALHWDNLLRDDSEEEILAMQKTTTATSWDVRKTTTVTCSQEVQPIKPKNQGQGRGQESYMRVE